MSAYDSESDRDLQSALHGLESARKPITLTFVFTGTAIHLVMVFLIGLLLRALFAGGDSVPVWIGVVSYLVIDILALTTHWLGHQPFTGSWFRAHVAGHHIHDYPSKRFFSRQYVNASVDNSVFYYPAMALTPLVVGLLRGGIWNWRQTLISFGMGLFVMVVADVYHVAYHLQSHWFFDRFEWFKTLRVLHYYHHKGGMMQNFAIGDFAVDVICGYFVSRNLWAKDTTATAASDATADKK